jgi:hypothetical protein
MVLDYLLHIAVTRAGTHWGRDALRKWMRAGFAQCPKCCAVLGTVRPPMLRILMRRVVWHWPLITPNEESKR